MSVSLDTRTANAVQDVIQTLKGVRLIDEVKTELTEAGTKPVRVTVLMGDYANEYRTGRLLRRTQSLVLTLDVKGTKSKTENLIEIAQAIDTALNTDPRRNGYAQTTITPGWEVESQSRDGSQLTTTISIDISER